MNISIPELENILKSEVININTRVSIDGISIDSRTIGKNELFIDANFNTSFVESHPELVDYEEEMSPDIIAAAIASAIAAHEGI